LRFETFLAVRDFSTDIGPIEYVEYENNYAEVQYLTVVEKTQKNSTNPQFSLLNPFKKSFWISISGLNKPYFRIELCFTILKSYFMFAES